MRQYTNKAVFVFLLYNVQNAPTKTYIKPNSEFNNDEQLLLSLDSARSWRCLYALSLANSKAWVLRVEYTLALTKSICPRRLKTEVISAC